MSPRTPASVRILRAQPDLVQLKRQAKELLVAFVAGNGDAAAEVNAHVHGARPETFALHDAQLVLARAYGFASWPKLKAYVDGVTVRRLAEAARSGDLPTARTLLEARPELINLCVAEDDEHRALHYAVIARDAAMVRLLMQRGADAHAGIWPHRDATRPWVMARDRGYAEILAIIEQEEAAGTARLSRTALSSDVVRAFQQGNEASLIAALEVHPELLHAADEAGRTILHWAALRLWPAVATWALDRGANVKVRTSNGDGPLDLLGDDTDAKPAEQPRLIAHLADVMVARGAEPGPRWAITTGDAEWLRRYHAERSLAQCRGLVTHAIRSNRPGILRLLLELGLDADETGRVEGLDESVITFGGPIRACAAAGYLTMAQCLLEHGANPNTGVYAASSALFVAHERHDRAMVTLLERHGARLDAAGIGALGLVDEAAAILAAPPVARESDEAAGDASSVAEALMWSAIERPSPAIVRMALDHVDWPREDGRWYGILRNGVYPGMAGNQAAHVEALSLVLTRADPNLRSRHGATLLHYVAAEHGRRTPRDRVTFASLLLDAGARLDLRDHLLRSTPLGWACRWGRTELLALFLERGADPLEPDAEPWASPAAWAEAMKRPDVLAVLRQALRS